jgi:hypothetical protein
MAIELIWDDTIPHVVHYRFQKGWTWEEFRQAALKEHTWGEALDGVRYDIIGDLTQAGVPAGTPFTNVARLFDQGPQNRRMIVIAGSSLSRVLIDVAGRVYPRVKGRFHAADTIEDARDLILRLRDESEAR